MADDIFSANPRSFKMDVKSPLAVWLKAAVDDKLIEFLGDCTDDVLSEYVVILVFNGKHQTQARDDLEAFLGERSGEFVSWLWNLLLKIDKQSHLLDGSSNLKGVNTSSDCCVLMDTEQGNHRLQGLKNYAMGDADEPLSSQSKDKKYCPLKSASQRPSNFMEFSKGFQHLLPTFDTSICDLNIKNIKDLRAQSYEHGVVTRSGSVVDNHEVLKYESYGRKGSSNISSGNAQSTKYLNQHKKDRWSIVVAMRCLINFCAHQTENQHLGICNQWALKNLVLGLFFPSNAARTKHSSRAVDRISQEDIRPRRSVWDRLGKPCEGNTMLRCEKLEVHGIDVSEKKILDNGKLDQNRSKHFAPGYRLGETLIGETPVPYDGHGSMKSKTNTIEHRRLGHGLKTKCSPLEENNFNKKRPFGEIAPCPANCSVSSRVCKDGHDQDIDPLKISQRSPYAKCSISSKKLNGEATATQNPVQSTLNSETETLNNEEAVYTTNLNPVEAQMLDVKARLHQIEVDISMFRSEKLQSMDVKSLLPLSSGAFCCNKRSFIAAFCQVRGMVVKVVILNDHFTAQPKGAAFITFASEESADEAVALNGVSFLCRNLKVVRKAEMHARASAPAQPSGRSSRSESYEKVILQRPFSGSRLQWRREQNVDATSSHPRQSC